MQPSFAHSKWTSPTAARASTNASRSSRKRGAASAFRTKASSGKCATSKCCRNRCSVRARRSGWPRRSPEAVTAAATMGHSILQDPHSSHAEIGAKRASYRSHVVGERFLDRRARTADRTAARHRQDPRGGDRNGARRCAVDDRFVQHTARRSERQRSDRELHGRHDHLRHARRGHRQADRAAAKRSASTISSHRRSATRRSCC